MIIFLAAPSALFVAKAMLSFYGISIALCPLRRLRGA
jgi:hypothetical protein